LLNSCTRIIIQQPMKTRNILLVASTWSSAAAWSTTTTIKTTNNSRRLFKGTPRKCPRTWGNEVAVVPSSTTRLNAGASDKKNSADALFEMVDNIDKNSDVVKIQELEKSLAILVENERQNKRQQNSNNASPKPPAIPPSKAALKLAETQQQEDEALEKAEQALLKLRQRLSQEEETMRKAEAALKKSLGEEETLRKAEEALQRSRLAAEERKALAILRTEAAAASANESRQKQDEIKRQAIEIENNLKRIVPRATISLDSIFQGTFSGNKDEVDEDDYDDDIGLAILEPAIKMDAPPKGVATLFNWVQSGDGSITGRIKDSGAFYEGSRISTSPIALGAVGGTVVTTASGSK
jgi:hypothetical protein